VQLYENLTSDYFCENHTIFVTGQEFFHQFLSVLVLHGSLLEHGISFEHRHFSSKRHDSGVVGYLSGS